MNNFDFFGITKKGKRNENQDDFIIFYNKHKCLIAAVADGMGGHNHGKLASNLAINMTRKIFDNDNFCQMSDREIQDVLVKKIREIQAFFLKTIKEKDLNFDMGTTFNLNIFCKQKLFTLNIGDSRATKIQKNHILQISEDHNLATLANKDKKFQKYKNFTNFLTSVLGPHKEAKLDIFKTKLINKGYVSITTDGVHNHLTNHQLQRILRKKNGLPQKIEDIIKKSKDNDSTDNMTCILVKYDFSKWNNY